MAGEGFVFLAFGIWFIGNAGSSPSAGRIARVTGLVGGLVSGSQRGLFMFSFNWGFCPSMLVCCRSLNVIYAKCCV